MKRALLFDLDDTLVVEEPAAAAAFLATAEVAVARHRVQADRLALAARERARELWYATPAHPYCLRVGISSWEGLWCRFEGEAPMCVGCVSGLPDTGERHGASLSPTKASTTQCWQRSWERDMGRSAERAMIASPTCRPAWMSCATPTNSRSSPTGRRAYSARSSPQQAWTTISTSLLSRASSASQA